jgi:jumonji domain-containing protein 7
LRKEISNLQDNFPSGIEWAEEAFGPSQPLDAVNLWMGNELAVSSMHKDHYENLFYVASGEKIFTVSSGSE